jgi:ATP-dependent DNA helicase RecQ
MIDAEGGAGLASFSTARLADELDLAPADLEQRLAEWVEAGHLTFRARDRDACLEVLAPPPDAERRLRRLLDETRAENVRRLDSILAYLEAKTCRHVVLAAHFGERLPACATACDLCAARQRRGPGRRAEADSAAEAAPAVRKASAATASDALTALAAARTLPFPVGKTGLMRLLQGSITSSIKADRSQQFGKLEHLSSSRIDALIERLIAAGYLDRDESHEYRLLSVTERGREATEADLAAVADPAPPPKLTIGRAADRAPGRSAGRAATDAAPAGEIDMDQWDSEQHALLERLRRWRNERASAEGMPAYIIMPNETLIYLVARQPRSIGDFAGVKGFGPARVQRYGDEVLRLIQAAAAT